MFLSEYTLHLLLHLFCLRCDEKSAPMHVSHQGFIYFCFSLLLFYYNHLPTQLNPVLGLVQDLQLGHI